MEMPGPDAPQAGAIFESYYFTFCFLNWTDGLSGENRVVAWFFGFS